jgi:hypothetical protein
MYKTVGAVLYWTRLFLSSAHCCSKMFLASTSHHGVFYSHKFYSIGIPDSIGINVIMHVLSRSGACCSMWGGKKWCKLIIHELKPGVRCQNLMYCDNMASKPSVLYYSRHSFFLMKRACPVSFIRNQFTDVAHETGPNPATVEPLRPPQRHCLKQHRVNYHKLHQELNTINSVKHIQI